MTSYDDQMEIFRLVAGTLKDDLVCYAFGGTAMLFYGYKDETKDIDLLFEDEKPRKAFIAGIRQLGFEETSPLKIYIPEKLRDRHRPLMLRKDASRFDLFVGKIFRTRLSPGMKDNLYAVHEFRQKATLTVKVLSKEHIVQLKAITERQNDFDDIRSILEKEKSFDWQYLIDEVIWQYRHGDSWALLDTEKMMTGLKSYVFIPKKYLDQIYACQK
jgi:hypothetical protein